MTPPLTTGNDAADTARNRERVGDHGRGDGPTRSGHGGARPPALAWRIAVPLAGTFLVCFALVAFVTVTAATDEVEQARRREMALAASVLSRPGFPLTPEVMESVGVAWGVELAVCRDDGTLDATTLPEHDALSLTRWWKAASVDVEPPTTGEAPPLGRVETIALGEGGGVGYRLYWRWREGVAGQSEALVVLVPTDEIDQAKRAAALPALLASLLGVVLTTLASVWLARSVARPLGVLADRAGRVQRGDLETRAPEGRTVEHSRELSDLTHAFNAMVDSLARSRDALLASERHATLGRIAAHLAHELRGPLAGVRLNLDCLARDVDDDTARELLREIDEEVARLTGIADDLLGAFREAPQAEHEPLDLADVVAQTARLIEPHLAHLRAALTVDVKPVTGGTAGFEVRGAVGPLKQVLWNLLLNAGQACAPRGHGAITLTLEPATANVDAGGPRGVRVTIADDGPGIPADLLPRAFDPFVSARHDNEGTGLGLAIVKGILDQHDATITLDSTPTGTTATITFPLPA